MLLLLLLKNVLKHQFFVKHCTKGGTYKINKNSSCIKKFQARENGDWPVLKMIK